MGRTPEDKIGRWMAAAGQAGKIASVQARVVTAGEFLEKTARMDERSACSCLTGIDFSKPVKLVRLPPKVYVQYLAKHKGIWFTDTGLTPDLVGLAEGKRTRKLFTPVGVVHALESTARAIKDTWTHHRLFQSIAPTTKKKMGQLTRGGGVQYIVFDKHCMKAV
jgi:hypothetical protein